MPTPLAQRARATLACPGVAGAVSLLLAAAAAALLFDLPLQQAAIGQRPPGVVRDYFKATEAFGNGFGVAMIVAAVAVLDPTRRVQTSRLLAASLGAGVLADTIKMTIARSRPSATPIEELLAAGDTSLDTFLGLLPLMTHGSGGQSFPSAHTATAVGLAVALSSAYPGARRMWYAFAAGVALQRVCVGAHYLSDVLTGAALGAAWGRLCWGQSFARQGAVAAAFDRLETWWATRFGWRLPEGHAGTEQLRDGGAAVITMPTRPATAIAVERRAA